MCVVCAGRVSRASSVAPREDEFWVPADEEAESAHAVEDHDASEDVEYVEDVDDASGDDMWPCG